MLLFWAEGPGKVALLWQKLYVHCPTQYSESSLEQRGSLEMRPCKASVRRFDCMNDIMRRFERFGAPRVNSFFQCDCAEMRWADAV